MDEGPPIGVLVLGAVADPFVNAAFDDLGRAFLVVDGGRETVVLDRAVSEGFEASFCEEQPVRVSGSSSGKVIRKERRGMCPG